jgi:glycosyltransferase involved in cell wall biosynthesis
MTTRSGRRVKVLALQRESLVAPGVPSLSVSARVTEVLDYLESLGYLDYSAVSESDACAGAAIGWAQVLILSKHNSPAALGLAQMASSRGLGIVYDIDDWIFSFPAYSGGRAVNERSFSKEIIGLADVVTVANAELLARVPHVIPEIEPVLMPNGIWVERYADSSAMIGQEAERPRILFTNADFLKVQSARDAILSALQVFFMRHPDYVLDFFGDPFPEMFSLPFLHFTNRMPYESFMRAIVSGGYQFAITPLGGDEDEDATEFNACKNPFKYINYGTAKIPGIYSNAEIYKTCVRDGTTGLLVDNEFASWYAALERMAADRALRDAMRAAAYGDIIANFHVERSAAVLRGIIEAFPARESRTEGGGPG